MMCRINKKNLIMKIKNTQDVIKLEVYTHDHWSVSGSNNYFPNYVTAFLGKHSRPIAEAKWN